MPTASDTMAPIPKAMRADCTSQYERLRSLASDDTPGRDDPREQVTTQPHAVAPRGAPSASNRPWRAPSRARPDRRAPRAPMAGRIGGGSGSGNPVSFSTTTQRTPSRRPGPGGGRRRRRCATRRPGPRGPPPARRRRRGAARRRARPAGRPCGARGSATRGRRSSRSGGTATTGGAPPARPAAADSRVAAVTQVVGHLDRGDPAPDPPRERRQQRDRQHRHEHRQRRAGRGHAHEVADEHPAPAAASTTHGATSFWASRRTPPPGTWTTRAVHRPNGSRALSQASASPATAGTSTARHPLWRAARAAATTVTRARTAAATEPTSSTRGMPGARRGSRSRHR